MVATGITVVFGVSVLRSKVNEFLGLLDEEAVQTYEEENYGEDTILAQKANICSYRLHHDTNDILGGDYTVVGIALCEINIERGVSVYIPIIDLERLKIAKYQFRNGLDENKNLYELIERQTPSI